MNEEIGRLKKALTTSKEDEDIANDSQMIEKADKVLKLLENFTTRNIDNDMIMDVLRIQNLARELDNGS